MLNIPTSTDPPSQYSSALTSNGDNETEDINHDDQELLRDLRQGQSRIREIKSLLLEQRDKLTRLKQDMEERLSTKVLRMNEDANDVVVEDVGDEKPPPPPRICPMCELEFSRSSISEEEFETHVLDHFVYLEEDQGDLETMMYVGSGEESNSSGGGK